MTWIIGREPGFPKSVQTADLSSGKVVTITTDEYKVYTPDEDVALSETILTGLPSSLALGSRLGSCGLRQRTAERDPKNRQLWHVPLEYSSEIDEESSEDQTKPPDQRRVKYNWDFETRDILFSKDVDTGLAVANSVEEPFELTTEFVIPVLNLSTYRVSFPPNIIKDYVNRTNSEVFWGFPKRTVAMAGIRDSETEEVYNGIRYRSVQYVLKMMIPKIDNVIDGWKEFIMDRGSFYKEGGVKKVFTAQGSRIVGKLDGSGGKLADGAVPIFKTFNRLPQTDFRALGIDLDQLNL